MEKQEALKNLKGVLEQVVNSNYEDDVLYNEILDKADDLLEILDCYLGQNGGKIMPEYIDKSTTHHLSEL